MCVCICVCALHWISLNELFFAEAVTSPSELGTWHDNWSPCNLCLKWQHYLCQHDFVWTRRHTGEGPQSPFKPHAGVCSEILGGISIVTMAIYLRCTLPHLLQLLPWPYAWSFLKGSRGSLISLVPSNSETSLPKVERRGDVFPVKVMVSEQLWPGVGWGVGTSCSTKLFW